MTSFCKACNAPIKWITTLKGKKMPVNDVPEDVTKAEAKHILINSIGEVVTGDVAKLSPNQNWYSSHFASCPNAKELRKARKPQQPNMDKNYRTPCTNCGELPTVGTSALCGPCFFGEAETLGGNW